MKVKLLALCGLCATSLYAQSPPATPAVQTAQPDILDRAVNQPGVAWTFYGAGHSEKAVRAVGIPGEQAVRVTITAKGANAWDVGALYPTTKPIAANDTMLVAVYLRAPNVQAGQTTAISFVGATGGDAPYPPLASASVQIGPEWKIYYAAGMAPQAFAPGKARIAVHLAGAKQVLELGPAFLLDFGAGYDPAKLPKN